MGREIKRVALDFAWPLGEVWDGFVNPYGRPCPEKDKTCFNGQTAAAQWLDALCRMFGTVADSGLGGPHLRERGTLWPHPYLVEFPTAPTHEIPADVAKGGIVAMHLWMRSVRKDDFVLAPTREFSEFYSGLTGDKGDSLFGFIGSNGAWKFQTKLRELAGVPETWGECPTCKGEGMDPSAAAAYEAWDKTEPPAGEGWQVWETVSEGSPITPVFATAEELATHLSTVGTSWKSDPPVSYEAALRFIKAGWMISAVSDGRGNFASGLGVAETLPERD